MKKINTHKHLADTGISVSEIGFGTYRFYKTPEHKETLKAALLAGINLIDTSSNYTNGDSETAIGEVVAPLVYDEELKREELCIITKAGYIQGDNYATLSKQFPETVHINNELSHCIHPDFLEHQLKQSLDRMQQDYVDVFLLHNPEYFFDDPALKNTGIESQHEHYYKRIKKAFSFLETCVQKGQIRYYGISSNTFACTQEHDNSTSFDRILTLAEESAATHFKVIQCPFNVLEHKAASLFNDAKKHNIATLSNRPLNAIQNNSLLRLIDVDEDIDISQLEIEDMLEQGHDLEAGLKESLIEYEAPAIQIEYLNFFNNLNHIYQQNPGILSFKTTLANHVLLAIEQYINTLNFETLKPSLQEQLEFYFASLNSCIQSINAYFSATHNSHIISIKQELNQTNDSYLPERQMRHLAIAAYRNTPNLDCILMGIRNHEQLEYVLNELHQTPSESPLDWSKFRTASFYSEQK